MNLKAPLFLLIYLTKSVIYQRNKDVDTNPREKPATHASQGPNQP